MDQQSPIYQIRIKGQLQEHWADWFDGLTITYDTLGGETLLEGPVTDQPALHGILNKIRDLGLSLLSLKRIDQNA